MIGRASGIGRTLALLPSTLTLEQLADFSHSGLPWSPRHSHISETELVGVNSWRGTESTEDHSSCYQAHLLSNPHFLLPVSPPGWNACPL